MQRKLPHYDHRAAHKGYQRQHVLLVSTDSNLSSYTGRVINCCSRKRSIELPLMQLDLNAYVELTRKEAQFEADVAKHRVQAEKAVAEVIARDR